MPNNDKRIFIGGAWPYANNSMHVGHLAALLPGDIIARYYRDNGSDVIYISGTDTHGTPITVSAKKQGVEPKVIAEKYHKEFGEVFQKLGFTFDAYGATYEESHKQRAMEFLKSAYDNGHMYAKDEKQDFCNPCNTFLTDRDIVGKCPVCGGQSRGDQCDSCLTSLEANQLTEKKCKTCGESTELKDTKHLMFKLSEFKNFIQEYKTANEQYWRPNAQNETQKYLQMGLPDRAVTRSIPWGVDVPVPGFEDKKIYVWFEAVLGYLSLGEAVAKQRGISLMDFLKDDGKLETYYAHGKDNIPFHTVIFPALLGALNLGIQLPKHIVSSEYITTNNQKMSKSLGNLISATDLANTFDADTVRFYVSTISPEKRDTNFSVEDMIQTHNKVLLGGFGNFVNRVQTFTTKKFEGVVPDGIIDQAVRQTTQVAYDEIGRAIENGEIKLATDKIKDYIQFANKYFADKEPWKMKDEKLVELKNVMATSAFMIRNMANLFEPFLPNATASLKQMMGVQNTEWQVCDVQAGTQLQNIGVLYSTLEYDEEAKKIQEGSIKIKNQAVKQERKEIKAKAKVVKLEKADQLKQTEKQTFEQLLIDTEVKRTSRTVSPLKKVSFVIPQMPQNDTQQTFVK